MPGPEPAQERNKGYYETVVIREHWLSRKSGHISLVFLVQARARFCWIFMRLEGRGWGFTRQLLEGLGLWETEGVTWTDIVRSLDGTGRLCNRAVQMKVTPGDQEGKEFLDLYPVGDKGRLKVGEAWDWSLEEGEE